MVVYVPFPCTVYIANNYISLEHTTYVVVGLLLLLSIPMTCLTFRQGSDKEEDATGRDSQVSVEESKGCTRLCRRKCTGREWHVPVSGKELEMSFPWRYPWNTHNRPPCLQINILSQVTEDYITGEIIYRIIYILIVNKTSSWRGRCLNKRTKETKK